MIKVAAKEDMKLDMKYDMMPDIIDSIGESIDRKKKQEEFYNQVLVQDEKLASEKVSPKNNLEE